MHLTPDILTDIKCVNALDTGTRIDWITHFLYLRKKHQAMKIVITDHGDIALDKQLNQPILHRKERYSDIIIVSRQTIIPM